MNANEKANYINIHLLSAEFMHAKKKPSAVASITVTPLQGLFVQQTPREIESEKLWAGKQLGQFLLRART